MSGVLVWTAIAIAAVALFLLVQFVYLVAVLAWGDEIDPSMQKY